jgi:hypothetical protein
MLIIIIMVWNLARGWHGWNRNNGLRPGFLYCLKQIGRVKFRTTIAGKVSYEKCQTPE